MILIFFSSLLLPLLGDLEKKPEFSVSDHFSAVERVKEYHKTGEKVYRLKQQSIRPHYLKISYRILPAGGRAEAGRAEEVRRDSAKPETSKQKTSKQKTSTQETVKQEPAKEHKEEQQTEQKKEQKAGNNAPVRLFFDGALRPRSEVKYLRLPEVPFSADYYLDLSGERNLGEIRFPPGDRIQAEGLAFVEKPGLPDPETGDHGRFVSKGFRAKFARLDSLSFPGKESPESPAPDLIRLDFESPGVPSRDSAGLSSPRTEEISLTVARGTQEDRFRAPVRSPRWSFSFLPFRKNSGSYQVSIGNAGPAYLRVLSYVLLSRSEQTEPIRIDLESLLHWNLPRRGRDFEIFSWQFYPEILILLMKDYRTQARYLKRLAYFVEKKKYAGTLVGDPILRYRKGWNAHDYPSSVIADFFTKARKENFPLNREEKQLEKLLLKLDVIRPVPGGFKGGKAVLLSISSQSYPLLRKKLLTHEVFHGLYFSSPAYRADVHRIWGELSEKEQFFWKVFLGRRGYNPRDRDLMINEFQSYLLQSPLRQTPGYIRLNLRYLLGLSLPEKERKILKEMMNESDFFKTISQKLDETVKKRFGVEAGNNILLRRESEKRERSL